MTGDAEKWYALLEKNQDMPTWDEFEKLVNQRFGPPIRGNALGKLIQLGREMTVADYQSHFLALVNRCKGLSEPHQISIFTTGLCDPLKTDVELEQPATLEKVIALACAYEHWLAMMVDTAARSGSRQTFNRAKQLAQPAPPAVASRTVGTTTPTTPGPRFKRLTVAEMAARWARGECYNYTEKFNKEHLEVCPVKGIFLLEMETSVAADLLDDTTPQISLNVITWISAAETMKLFIRLGTDTITALVDSGSMHSFISTETVCHLHLEPVFHPSLQVTVTNGDKVASADVCHDI
jgi:hypothetical protein